MKRALTAVVLVPVALAAVFLLDGLPFLGFLLIVVGAAAYEYARLLGKVTGPRIMFTLLIALPVAVLLLLQGAGMDGTFAWGVLITSVMASAALFSRQPPERVALAIGFLGFGLPYFSLPVVGLYRLQAIDPWYLVLVAAIVWLGDTAAYYIGTRWGRHRLAPVISPKKSWEGAIANIVAAGLAVAVWSWWRQGEVVIALLGLGLVTAVAAQVGDLVESAFKRWVGVKDSSALLPGHGGMWDRLDSLLFAAPVFAFGLGAIGLG